MKKMLLATALAYLLQDVLNRRLLFKIGKRPVAPKETITHHFFVSGDWAEENCRCSPKFVAHENVVKTKPSKHS